MDSKFIKFDHERPFYNAIAEMSDRELQELQANYLFQTKKNSERIKNNVIFIFYLTIACFVVTIFAISILSNAK